MGKKVLDKEIRDTADHMGEWFKTSDLNDSTLFLDNKLDQDVTVVLEGARQEDVEIGSTDGADDTDGMGSVDLIHSLDAAAGGKDYGTLTDRFEALRLRASCDSAPSSGSARVQLMGGHQ